MVTKGADGEWRIEGGTAAVAENEDREWSVENGKYLFLGIPAEVLRLVDHLVEHGSKALPGSIHARMFC
jgi:hypothetical protein